MRTARVTAAMLLLAWGAVASVAAFRHLPDSNGATLALVIALATVVSAALVANIHRVLRRAALSNAAVVTVWISATVLPITAILPGGITYSRFGLTVLGGLPIPLFDLVIRPNGFVWFRTKSHQIHREEIELLLADGCDTVIVAIGWDGVARVDPDVFELKQTRIEVLRTGEAFARYNALRARGLRVAILAHTTC